MGRPGTRVRFRPVAEALEGRALLAAVGALDPTFGTGGLVVTPVDLTSGGFDQAAGVAVLPSGQIVVAGSTQTDANGNFDFYVERLNATGALDTTFGTGGTGLVHFGFTPASTPTANLANGLAIQPNGDIVVVGQTKRLGTGDLDFAVARLLPTGQLDPSFGTGGLKILSPNLQPPTTSTGNDAAQAVAIAADGSILVAGYAQTALGLDVAVYRLNAADGSVSATFGSTPGQPGLALLQPTPGDTNAFATSVQPLPDGSVAIAGTTANAQTKVADFLFARLSPAGGADPTFGGTGAVAIAFPFATGLEAANSLALIAQPDGKLVAAGQVQTAANTFQYALARVNTNGTLDGSFGNGGKVVGSFGATPNNDAISSLVLQPNGQIAGAGRTTNSAGNADFALLRLNASGALDSSFGTGGVTTVGFNLQPNGPAGTASNNDVATALALDAAGNLVAAGGAQRSTNNYDTALARLIGAAASSGGNNNGGNTGGSSTPTSAFFGPRVLAVNPTTSGRKITGMVVVFDSSLNPTTAADRANFRLAVVSRRRLRGVAVALGRPILSRAGNSVALTIAHGYPNFGHLELTVSAALLGANGQPLNGSTVAPGHDSIIEVPLANTLPPRPALTLTRLRR